MGNYNSADNSEEVLTVMKEYRDDKGFRYSDSELEFVAENCYLHFESQQWKGVKYWPAACMRWLLNNAKRDGKLPLKSGENFRKRILGN